MANPWIAHDGGAQPAGIADEEWVEARFNTPASDPFPRGLMGRAHWIYWPNVTSWRRDSVAVPTAGAVSAPARIEGLAK